MQDELYSYPELLEASEEAGLYFGIVRLERESEQRCFRFGVSRDGYLALKRALQMRPFDQMPGVRRRFFFIPSVQRNENRKVIMVIRVEQGNARKNLDIEAPVDLVSNLIWFYKLDDWGKAEQLAVPDPRLE